MTKAQILLLCQLASATPDRLIASLTDRNDLVMMGYAKRTKNGWNIATAWGVEVLVNMGKLK